MYLYHFLLESIRYCSENATVVVVVRHNGEMRFFPSIPFDRHTTQNERREMSPISRSHSSEGETRDRADLVLIVRGSEFALESRVQLWLISTGT